MLLCTGEGRADVEQSKAHFKKATSAFALGHMDDAAVEFEKAYEAEPDPALLYNAAQAHRMAGHKDRALMLYQNYLKLYGKEIPNKEEVKRHIADLKRAIAEES